MAPATALAFSLWVAALPPPPSKVVRETKSFGTVTIDHAAHLARRVTCVRCHISGRVGKIEFTPKTAHEACRDCHAEVQKGPTECRGCHVVSPGAAVGRDVPEPPSGDATAPAAPTGPAARRGATQRQADGSGAAPAESVTAAAPAEAAGDAAGGSKTAEGDARPAPKPAAPAADAAATSAGSAASAADADAASTGTTAPPAEAAAATAGKGASAPPAAAAPTASAGPATAAASQSAATAAPGTSAPPAAPVAVAGGAPREPATSGGAAPPQAASGKPRIANTVQVGMSSMIAAEGLALVPSVTAVGEFRDYVLAHTLELGLFRRGRTQFLVGAGRSYDLKPGLRGSLLAVGGIDAALRPIALSPAIGVRAGAELARNHRLFDSLAVSLAILGDLVEPTGGRVGRVTFTLTVSGGIPLVRAPSPLPSPPAVAGGEGDE